MVVNSVPGVEDASGVLGIAVHKRNIGQAASDSSLSTSELASAVVSRQSGLSDCLAHYSRCGRFVCPSKVSSCIGAPKQLRVQQPVIVHVFSLSVEFALAAHTAVAALAKQAI